MKLDVLELDTNFTIFPFSFLQRIRSAGVQLQRETIHHTLGLEFPFCMFRNRTVWYRLPLYICGHVRHTSDEENEEEEWPQPKWIKTLTSKRFW